MRHHRGLLALALPALLASGAAHAIKERPASAADTAAWVAACRPPSPVRLQSALSGDAALPMSICPLCGWAAIGAFDHGEDGCSPPD